jgi:hypothetical protein
MKQRGEPLPRLYEVPSGEIGRAVVVHDSFFQVVEPYLARHFRRSLFLRRIFAPELIAGEQPEIVIEEMVERVLSRPGFLPEQVAEKGRSASLLGRSLVRRSSATPPRSLPRA